MKKLNRRMTTQERNLFLARLKKVDFFNVLMKKEWSFSVQQEVAHSDYYTEAVEKLIDIYDLLGNSLDFMPDFTLEEDKEQWVRLGREIVNNAEYGNSFALYKTDAETHEEIRTLKETIGQAFSDKDETQETKPALSNPIVTVAQNTKTAIDNAPTWLKAVAGSAVLSGIVFGYAKVLHPHVEPVLKDLKEETVRQVSSLTEMAVQKIEQIRNNKAEDTQDEN